MKGKIFKARYETAEFLAADSCLVCGGFLIGTDLVNFASVFGGVLVSLGLFLGIRVLLRFSSDLKDIKAQVDVAVENSKRTNEEVKENTRLLRDAESDLMDAQSDAREALSKSEKAEERVFGNTGITLPAVFWGKSLQHSVDELRRDVDRLQRDVEDGC